MTTMTMKRKENGNNKNNTTENESKKKIDEIFGMIYIAIMQLTASHTTFVLCGLFYRLKKKNFFSIFIHVPLISCVQLLQR